MSIQHFVQKKELRRNPRTQCSLLWAKLPLICMEDVDHDVVWQAWWSEIWQQGAHAPNCSFECDGYNERGLSSTRSPQHVYDRNESERLFIRMSLRSVGFVQYLLSG